MFTSPSWHGFLAYSKNTNMEKEERQRNRPAEKGRKNDPELRDRSGIQPGTGTISRSETDPDNEKRTRTSISQDHPECPGEPKPDRIFDEPAE
jgi:hypothetical protein